MVKQQGMALLFVLVLLVVLGSLFIVGAKAQQYFLRGSQIAFSNQSLSQLGLNTLRQYRQQLQHNGEAESVINQCLDFLVEQQESLDCKVAEYDWGEVWALLAESHLYLLALPMNSGTNFVDGMWVFRFDHSAWQEQNLLAEGQWFLAKHPVNGKWRDEGVKTWWQEGLL